MNRLFSRILAVSLAALILIAMLVSCGGGKGDDKADAAVTTAGEAGDTAETGTTRIEPDLPEKDFGGYKFNVLTKGTSNVHWKSKDIFAAELNGEIINDSVFERNSKIGEKYNFSITEQITSQGTWNMHSDVSKMVLAGEDTIDMSAGGLTGDLRTLSSGGMLIDLKTVPYMDLTQPYYDQNCNAQISINNHLYATTGDLIVMDNEATIAIIYSKKMAEDNQLGDFYEDIDKGSWTTNRMLECATVVSADLNGDGIHDEFDAWGVIGEVFNTLVYIYGTGERIIEKDKDDLPTLALENERFYTAFEKSIAINGNFDICMYASNFTKYTDVWTDCIDKAFAEDRALFNTAGLVRVTVFRGKDTDFGILPLPKLDEKQTEYYSPVSVGCSNSITIPATASDLDRTGIIIEALSCESMYTLTPAYYEITVKGKAIRDEKSAEVLDMIFANRVYDLGYMYDWGSIASKIMGLTGSTSPNIASTIASTVGAAETKMQETIDQYLALD